MVVNIPVGSINRRGSLSSLVAQEILRGMTDYSLLERASMLTVYTGQASCIELHSVTSPMQLSSPSLSTSRSRHVFVTTPVETTNSITSGRLRFVDIIRNITPASTQIDDLARFPQPLCTPRTTTSHMSCGSWISQYRRRACNTCSSINMPCADVSRLTALSPRHIAPTHVTT